MYHHALTTHLTGRQSISAVMQIVMEIWRLPAYSYSRTCGVAGQTVEINSHDAQRLSMWHRLEPRHEGIVTSRVSRPKRIKRKRNRAFRVQLQHPPSTTPTKKMLTTESRIFNHKLNNLLKQNRNEDCFRLDLQDAFLPQVEHELWRRFDPIQQWIWTGRGRNTCFTYG